MAVLKALLRPWCSQHTLHRALLTPLRLWTLQPFQTDTKKEIRVPALPTQWPSKCTALPPACRPRRRSMLPTHPPGSQSHPTPLQPTQTVLCLLLHHTVTLPHCVLTFDKFLSLKSSFKIQVKGEVKAKNKISPVVGFGVLSRMVVVRGS